MNLKITFQLKLAMACALMATFVSANADSSNGMRQKSMEISSIAFDKAAALQHRAEVHEWLMSEALVKGMRDPLSVDVTAAEMNDLDNAPRGVGPDRVGLARSTNVSVSFKDVSVDRLKGRTLARNFGAISRSPDGGYVFTAALSSPGAMALRVHFAQFDLPEKAGLFLFNQRGEVFGPYTRNGPQGNGEFWSNTLMGDTLYLQLRHVGPVSNADLRRAGFKVAGVGHIRPRLQSGLCGFNASCVENATCGTDPAANDAKDAVAVMLFQSGRYYYICTGGLVADTDDNSNIPYFLTANHCISKGREASSLEAFFQFKDSCSNPVCDDFENHPIRTLGSTIKAKGRNTDYTLLQLSEPAPAGSAFLGWDSTPVAFTHGLDLYRISHPSGAPQAYSEHLVDANTGTCGGWPRGDRIYSYDTFGATEGGSSGSPVLNSLGQVVGQLSGACGTNLDDVCDADNNATVDVAFAAYFDQVAQFLDPGECIPEPENCSDGVDNDCDGDVDGDDSDCGGGSGGPGDPCVSNGDCLSNKCKGKPGNMTCR